MQPNGSQAQLTKRAVFLDRDGVINRAFVFSGVPTPPRTLEDVEILPGVRESIASLYLHSFEVVIVSNQPDAARGLVSRESIAEINEFLKDELGVFHFYVCFHDDADNCSCRKPKPGLILEAARNLSINLSLSYMVGDRWRDILAGQKAGCDCFFIDYKYIEKRPSPPFTGVSSLHEATRIILEKSNEDID